MVLVVVMATMALALFGTVSLATMIGGDMRLIKGIKETEQARFLAEAGINHALAKIKDDGFAARANFTNSLDTGSYRVVFTTVSGRYLVTSTGIAGKRSVIVSAEIADATPTSLSYFSGAGNDIRINALVADANIIGDIHANNDVYLKSGPIVSALSVAGDVSATGIVKEGSRLHMTDGFWGGYLDRRVYINGVNDDNGVVYEGKERITFPTFNYPGYKNSAIESGDYYDGDHTFSSAALDPANGVVYVSGNATFTGSNTLQGGIVANNIIVRGTLSQTKKGTRNVVIAKAGDISVYGRLYTGEALVYAAQDIISLQLFADIEINGIMLARRDIDMWNFLTDIDYRYVYIAPSEMLGENGEEIFRLVSWNR